MTKREFGITKPLAILHETATEKLEVLSAPLDERTLDPFEEVYDYWKGQNN